MTFLCVQTQCFLFSLSTLIFLPPPLLYTPRIQYTSPAPNNPCSHGPTTVSVYVFPALLSILGVCEVGCITIASTITPIPSPLSVVSACPTIIPVSEPVSIYSAVPTVLLMSLPSVSEVYSLSTALPLPSENSNLESGPAVANKEDVILSCLPVEGCLQAVTVAEEVLFRVELDAEFSIVCSL